eukprot:5789150-Pyramimonas_sp.AAC.1
MSRGAGKAGGPLLLNSPGGCLARMEAHLDCAITGVERILSCLEGGAGALLPPGSPSSMRSGGVLSLS